MVADGVRSAEHVLYPVRDPQCVRLVGDALGDHEEHVRADAGHHVVVHHRIRRAQALAQSPGDLVEKLIAVSKTKAFVDGPEVVDVDEQQGEVVFRFPQ